MAEYALYLGDKFIDIGTIEELKWRNHISAGTIYYALNWEKRKNKKKYDRTLIAIKISDLLGDE